MFLTFSVLTAALIVIIPLYIFLKSVKRQDAIKEFPEPPANLIFGHGLMISSPTTVLEVAATFIERLGKNVKLRIGPSFAPVIIGLVTTDHKLMEMILSSNEILTKSENYKYIKPWLGNGLIISDGKYWRRHRKMLTPAFHFGILKEFVEVFETVGDILVEKLGKFDGLPSVDLDPLVTLCTLDIICETAMGIKINAQSGENSDYVNSVGEICRLFIRRNISPLKLFNSTYWLTKDCYLQRKVLEILHGFTLGVINSKQNNLNEKRNTKHMAFLDLLLKLSDDEGVRLTREELREEVDTFMFAGHDTTSSAIGFTLFCLSNHSDIQDKVLQEQKLLLGEEKNPLVAYADLQNMKYLENVIRETLRLYPPVPVLGRYIQEDIHFDGRVIPKTTNLALFIYGMHRDPEYFPEPEKFNPDRFENFDNSMPYSYIPFSAGARNCIGQKFAMLEMKSIISKIIRNFEIVPANPRHSLVLSVEVVLKSVSGVKVGLKMRN